MGNVCSSIVEFWIREVYKSLNHNYFYYFLHWILLSILIVVGFSLITFYIWWRIEKSKNQHCKLCDRRILWMTIFGANWVFRCLIMLNRVEKKYYHNYCFTARRALNAFYIICHSFLKFVIIWKSWIFLTLVEVSGV